jgi:hypothetical protein
MNQNPPSRTAKATLSPKAYWIITASGALLATAAAGALAVGHIFWHVRLSWELVAVMGIMLLPCLLPVLSLFVGRLSVIEMRSFETLISLVDSRPTQNGANPHDTDSGALTGGVAAGKATTRGELSNARIAKKFEEYSRPARFLLKTLWNLQSRHFGEEPTETRRVGYLPSSDAPYFGLFDTARLELLRDRLVRHDENGAVLLTDEGLKYCVDRKNQLADGNVFSFEMFPDFGLALEAARRSPKKPMGQGLP